MFNFAETTRLNSRIEALQLELFQLNEQKRPYEELEQEAQQAIALVASVHQKMQQLGVNARLDWQNAILEASGRRLTIKPLVGDFEGKLDKLQEQVDQLTLDLGTVSVERDAAIEERDRLLREIEGLKAQSDSEAISLLQKENSSLVVKIQELEKELEQAYSEGFDAGVVEYKKSEDASETFLNVLKLPCETEQTSDAEVTAREFVTKIKHKSHVDKTTWKDIAIAAQFSQSGIRELVLSAKSKTQKDLIAKIPELLNKYIQETGDRSPLDWVGDGIKNQLEI